MGSEEPSTPIGHRPPDVFTSPLASSQTMSPFVASPFAQQAQCSFTSADDDDALSGEGTQLGALFMHIWAWFGVQNAHDHVVVPGITCRAGIGACIFAMCINAQPRYPGQPCKPFPDIVGRLLGVHTVAVLVSEAYRVLPP